MATRVVYDMEGTGRFGGHRREAPTDVLAAASEAAWRATSAAWAQLAGAWAADEQFEAVLAAAGWNLKPPAKTRILGLLTVERGPLYASASAEAPAAIRRLLAATAEADFGTYELVVRLASAAGQPPRCTVVFADENVIELRSADASALTAVREAVERAAAAVGLRVTPRAK